MRSWSSICAALLVLFLAAPAFASHEPTDTQGDDGAALLLSSTSTTTTAVVGGIILTVVLATDADSMENYLEDNAVALETDLSLGAGETVDDLALAFRIDDSNRAAFGKIVRENRKQLLELANPEQIDRERAQQFVQVLLVASHEAGILDVEALTKG